MIWQIWFRWWLWSLTGFTYDVHFSHEVQMKTEERPGWGKMWVRNSMCKSGSSSISAACSESFLHWSYIIDKCNKIDRTKSIRMKQTGWLVSSIRINTHTHTLTHIQTPVYFFPTLFITIHFFPFLSISELMGKNGNVPVSQTVGLISRLPSHSDENTTGDRWVSATTSRSVCRQQVNQSVSRESKI